MSRRNIAAGCKEERHFMPACKSEKENIVMKNMPEKDKSLLEGGLKQLCVD